MYVWLVVDQQAYDAVGKRITQNLNTYDMSNIHIRRMNIEEHKQHWKEIIKDKTGRAPHTGVHTLGAYYRLFLHLILPVTVKHIIYMDTDVVVLVNLERLWKERQDVMFQMGASSSSGFMMFNVHRMASFWDVVQRGLLEHADWEWFSGSADQPLLRNVHRLGHGGYLTDAWDVHLAAGAWKHRNKLPEKVPQAGMLHFNGGGRSKQAYFNSTSGWSTRPGWTVVNYYIDMPWSWVRYMVGNDHDGRAPNANETNKRLRTYPKF